MRELSLGEVIGKGKKVTATNGEMKKSMSRLIRKKKGNKREVKKIYIYTHCMICTGCKRRHNSTG